MVFLSLLILTLPLVKVTHHAQADDTPSVGILDSFFGGVIEDSKNCYCSMTTIYHIGSPQGGIYAKPFTWANDLIHVTEIYDYGSVDKGHWVLGSAKLVPLPCVNLVFTVKPPFVKCEQVSDPRWAFGFWITQIGTN